MASNLWPLALGIGLAIGAGLGAAIDSIGAGIAIGTAVAVTVGLGLYRRSKGNSGVDWHSSRNSAARPSVARQMPDTNGAFAPRPNLPVYKFQYPGYPAGWMAPICGLLA